MKCTEFDSLGNVTVTAGEFSRSELCAKHGLQHRDLRRIDSRYHNQLPAILIRDEAILVNLGYIRALIKADLVMLFDAYGSSDTFNQSIFIYDLQDRLRSSSYGSGLAFEFRALEAILVSVVNSLHSEIEVLQSLVNNLLQHLEERIDRDKLKELLQYSKRLSQFEQRVLSIRNAIHEVLENDEDLIGMYLSDKKNGCPRTTHDSHEDAELLLESYLNQVEETSNVVVWLSAHMRSTEDIVNIMLDSQRNSLLLLELNIAMGTLGFTSGAFLASLFGMNLASTFEGSSIAFMTVSGAAMLTGTMLFFTVKKHLKHIASRM